MMEAVIAEIAPAVRVVHYAHGLPDYDTLSAARVLETLRHIASGIHVCVCDPDVGTPRRALAVATGRGDVLIGPDNGVLLPAATALGWIIDAREITNPAVMRQQVSPVFHARDVFAPAAAHLARGISFAEVGRVLDIDSLVPAPYAEANYDSGRWLARVIHVDKFGNAHLNISTDEWLRSPPPDRCSVQVLLASGFRLSIVPRFTFADVEPGAPLLVTENDGRAALAVNRGSFARAYAVRAGDEVALEYVPAPK